MVWSVAQQEAHSFLSSLLARRGVFPMPDMARTRTGKPYFPARPDLRFNLSHSGPWSMVALGEREIGCDIEVVRPRKESFPAYVLSERELEWYRGRGEAWEDFFTLWTLKEARVKCTGEGIRGKMRDISVPLLEPGESARWESFTFTAVAGESWRGAVCEKEGDIPI